jgi:hypothetical protein
MKLVLTIDQEDWAGCPGPMHATLQVEGSERAVSLPSEGVRVDLTVTWPMPEGLVNLLWVGGKGVETHSERQMVVSGGVDELKVVRNYMVVPVDLLGQ